MRLLLILIATFSFAQLTQSQCILKKTNGLKILSQTPVGNDDCSYKIEYCLIKNTIAVQHIEYTITFPGNKIVKTIKASGYALGSTICQTFNFTTSCNTGPSVLAVGKMGSMVCGVISENIILPLNLVNFYLEKNSVVTTSNSKPQTKLIWETEHELNTSHFVVQHSIDGKTFVDIGKVKATGLTNTNTKNRYEYIFNQTNNRTNYFRLKMMDRDQTYSYSPIISLKKEVTTSKLGIYPNPGNALVRIQTDEEFDPSALVIFQLNGQRINITESELIGRNIDISKWPNGTYLLHYKGEANTFVKQ